MGKKANAQKTKCRKTSWGTRIVRRLKVTITRHWIICIFHSALAMRKLYAKNSGKLKVPWMIWWPVSAVGGPPELLRCCLCAWPGLAQRATWRTENPPSCFHAGGDFLCRFGGDNMTLCSFCLLSNSRIYAFTRHRARCCDMLCCLCRIWMIMFCFVLEMFWELRDFEYFNRYWRKFVCWLLCMDDNCVFVKQSCKWYSNSQRSALAIRNYPWTSIFEWFNERF